MAVYIHKLNLSLIVLFSTVCLTISITGLKADQNPLVGEWVSVSRSRGGLGGAKIYESDGKVIATFGALIDLKYKISEGTLLLVDEKGSPFWDTNVNIQGSTMILKDRKTGQEQELKRIGETDRSGIIGKWIGDHYTGNKYIMHFTTSGNCYFAVPMVQTNGRYNLNGDKLTEEFPEKGKTKYNMALKNEILTLTTIEEKGIEKYKKKK